MSVKQVLKFDPINCVGCRVCEIICSMRHTGTCNPARARLKIEGEEDTLISSVRVCRRCKKAPCIAACPEFALGKDPETGVIILNQELCIGCGECVEACPFGAMFLDPLTEMPISCDLCGGDPGCVKFCSTSAIQLKPVGTPMDPIYQTRLAEAFANPVIQASVYKEEEGYQPGPTKG